MKAKWLKSLEEDGSLVFLSRSEKRLVEDVYEAAEEEIQHAVPCENGTDISVKISIVEENLRLIVQRLKVSGEVTRCFLQEYPRWERTRSDNVRALLDIGESLHVVRKRCNISRLVGNCTSFVGGGICIASAALAPLTFGLTTPLAVAGGTITVLGSATSVGTTITEMAKLRSKVKEANGILEQDKKSFEILKAWLTHATDLSEAFDRILAIDGENGIEGVLRILRDFAELVFASKNKQERSETVKLLVKSAIRKIPRELVHSTLTSNLVSLLLIMALLLDRNHRVFESATKTLKIMANLVTLVDFSVDVLQSASAFIKTDFAVATSVGKTITRAGVALFGMTLDMASIVLTSIDVHKGSCSGEGQKILETAEKLRQESNILGKVYTELYKMG